MAQKEGPGAGEENDGLHRPLSLSEELSEVVGDGPMGRADVVSGLWDYISENKDYPYYLIRDRFAGRGSRSLRSIRRGAGEVVDLDGEPAAVYRGLDGNIHVRSAVCTHMGCYVHWNDAERTWDCPCHGSRFKVNGDVLAGPAEQPLASVEMKQITRE